MGEIPMQMPKMDESSQARKDRAYLNEIDKYSYFVDPLVSHNMEGRDAYLECARKYMKSRNSYLRMLFPRATVHLLSAPVLLQASTRRCTMCRTNSPALSMRA